MKKMRVGAPSYFEILIAMAFLYFANQKVDIAVVEVGMGGEYDATNTLYPLVAVLTNVTLDHTNVLGGTVQKIAKTKAGIIKSARGPVAPSSHPMSSVAGSLRALDGTPSSRATPRFPNFVGSPRFLLCGEARPMRLSHSKSTREPSNNLIVVTGVKQPSVVKIVENRCREVEAKLYRHGKDFDFKIEKESLEGSVFDLTIGSDRGLQLNGLKLSLLGRHQVENASLAIETAMQLGKFGLEITEEHIRKALKTAFFPGRFEILRLTPFAQDKTSSTLVLDGAHNPTKMKAFLTSLKKLFPKEKKIFIVGFKFDKDIKRMLSQILEVADKIILTEFHGKTDISVSSSAKAESIKYQVLSSKYRGKIIVEPNSKKALDLTLNILVSQYPNIPAIIVVTGSLYLVGEVRSML